MKRPTYYLPFYAQVSPVNHCTYLCSVTISKTSHVPPYLFAYIHSGPLKVGWSPGKKKKIGPPIKDGPAKILHTGFVLMSKQYLYALP